MECRMAEEIEVLRGNLPQCHFCPSQNPTWSDPGRRGGKPATNRLSYGQIMWVKLRVKTKPQFTCMCLFIFIMMPFVAQNI
jgi:hypothetical protein